MTPEQINRLMAEKVMDFTKHGHNSWLNANDGEIWFLDEFDPYHRIEHAMMALEKFRLQGYWCHLFGRPEHWLCGLAHLTDTSKNDVLKEADTATAAICLACIEAKELE